MPAGVVSLRNRWKRVLRSCHAPFQRVLLFVRHLTDARAHGLVCVDAQEEALRSGIDADASTGKRTDGASRLFGLREGGADGSDVVCLPL